MNKALISECWLMMISWSLFLSGHEITAWMAAVTAAGLLYVSVEEVRGLRISLIQGGMFLAVLLVLNDSIIPYYFPGLPYFMIPVCIDAALLYEYLLKVKTGSILPVIYSISAAAVLIAALVTVLPESLYTLFTKRNLFIMEGFIFLPYFSVCALQIGERSLKRRVGHGQEKRIVSRS